MPIKLIIDANLITIDYDVVLTKISEHSTK